LILGTVIFSRQVPFQKALDRLSQIRMLEDLVGKELYHLKTFNNSSSKDVLWRFWFFDSRIWLESPSLVFDPAVIWCEDWRFE
jgi:hypothetical protein